MLLSSADFTALILTLKLAAVSTVILLVIGLPLAWWLARTRMTIKPILGRNYLAHHWLLVLAA